MTETGPRRSHDRYFMLLAAIPGLAGAFALLARRPAWTHTAMVTSPGMRCEGRAGVLRTKAVVFPPWVNNAITRDCRFLVYKPRKGDLSHGGWQARACRVDSFPVVDELHTLG